MDAVIEVEDLTKHFVLHTQGGAEIPVFEGLGLSVMAGECVALHGPSGAGKSTLLRSLYANYKPLSGSIRIRVEEGDGPCVVDLASAGPREVLQLRKRTLGYVSQFLRVIPRVPAREIVAEPLRDRGVDAQEALERAETMLRRLNIPERLMGLAPATFSGGEQQRINIARGFVAHYPVLLLDEPTASLDADNRDVVIQLIREAKARGAAIVGIFHDAEVRHAIADRIYPVAPHDAAAGDGENE
ncbi:phosphonate C-P lyase system protein PhnL [Oceanidesulfovibrio marinus]|uniref:Phosphonate C-P lyase system protein PhnL n=1 Tax=Oceanidesulfovibrio marinus TaxID=370038 RepID=A0ABX6NBH0_9BACT|nr:phosphonate C-P lyase system protein PhnL [Oceanidesulfovibrio marinus]QJT07934.1 phosphonate C-P lyase system protein PhnL [Oceanidesulfovibrio marinus]